jgi:putative ABC transport system permease protein
MTPPRLSRWLVTRLTPPDLRTSLLDDLDEAFARRFATRPSAARWWYRRQALASVWPLARLRRPRMPRLDELRQDGHYAIRALRRAPGFTAVALLSLALGIGATTAVFTVVNAVLLRPLPYPEAEQLVLVAPSTGGIAAVNLPQLFFFKAHASTFSSAGGQSGWSDVSVTDSGGTTEWIKSMQVSSGFFRTLGVVPQYGREFSADDMRPDAPIGVILNEALWQRRFGADPAIVGRTALFGTASYQVIGVLPRGLWMPVAAEAFFPLRITGRSSDNGLNTTMIARLAPGISTRQAETEMAGLSTQFAREFAGTGDDSFRGLTIRSYQAALVGDVRTNLLLLFGAVGVLLVIACSNLASLLVARFVARQKEIAVRLALGAGMGRLLRQFTVENLLLCTTGSALGVLVAYAALDAFLALVPFSLPVAVSLELDLDALVFAIGCGLITGALFSIAPLVTSARHATSDALKAGARAHGGSRRGQRVRGLLVVTEVALSVCLLVGATLLIQTLYKLRHEPLGFAPEGRLTFFTPAPAAALRDRAARMLFDGEMMDRLRAIPGVTAVAGTNVVPLTSQSNFPTERLGHPDDAVGGTEIRVVTPSYFEVMATSITRGRGFTSDDTASAPPVILVNETLARRWWRDKTPLGDQVVIGRYKGKTVGDGPGQPPRTVVGVVADTKSVFLKSAPRPTVYVPAAQPPWTTGGTTWVVRGDVERGLAERVRHTILAADPHQRIGRMQTMSDIVATATAGSRFDAGLCGAFAVVALMLTAIGVYGLLAFSIAQRTSEMGVRVALGATRVRIIGLVLRQGVGLTAAGLVIGLTAATWLSRFISTLLFGVRPTDLTSFALVSVVVLAVGVLASMIPARRAARVDPLLALRVE